MIKTSINLAAVSLLVAAGAVNAEADNAAGKQVYETSCARCHDSGTMGAPVTGDQDDWAEHTQLVPSDVHSMHLEDGYVKTVEKDKKKGVTEEQMDAAIKYILSAPAE